MCMYKEVSQLKLAKIKDFQKIFPHSEFFFFWSNLLYGSTNHNFLGWYSPMVQVGMLANCSFAWFCSSIRKSVSNKNKSYLLFRNEIDNILHYISKLNCSFADITNILLHYEILRYIPILSTMKSWNLYHFIYTYLLI